MLVSSTTCIYEVWHGLEKSHVRNYCKLIDSYDNKVISKFRWLLGLLSILYEWKETQQLFGWENIQMRTIALLDCLLSPHKYLPFYIAKEIKALVQSVLYHHTWENFHLNASHYGIKTSGNPLLTKYHMVGIQISYSRKGQRVYMLVYIKRGNIHIDTIVDINITGHLFLAKYHVNTYSWILNVKNTIKNVILKRKTQMVEKNLLSSSTYIFTTHQHDLRSSSLSSQHTHIPTTGMKNQLLPDRCASYTPSILTPKYPQFQLIILKFTLNPAVHYGCLWRLECSCVNSNTYACVSTDVCACVVGEIKDNKYDEGQRRLTTEDISLCG